MRLIHMSQLIFPALMMLIVACVMPAPCVAETPFVAAVSGNFFYMEGAKGTASDTFSQTMNNRVQATTWHGIPAWHITWNDRRINADHYIRMRDGAPLYAKRVNHAMHRSVEIQYSLDPAQPSIYRRKSKNEYVERKIWQTGLRDLGTLPQLLMSRQNAPDAKEFTFPVVNYDNGHVYNLIAKRNGVYKMAVLGRSVLCASYSVNIDSWMAAFNKSMHIIVPMQAKHANFLTYNGPDPVGTGREISLRLVSKSQNVALLSGQSIVGRAATN